MIDLNRFTEFREAVVPVVQNRFQYNRKKYEINRQSSYNGWFRVRIKGNDAEALEPVVAEFQEFSQFKIKGYSYNNTIIFQNFDVAKRMLKREVSAELNLNRAETFTPVEAVLWEDKNLYFYRVNYNDVPVYELKSRFHCNEPVPDDMKGITPELKTVYLFHAVQELEKDQAMRDAWKRNSEADYKLTLNDKLTFLFKKAGAELITFSLKGDVIIVDWKLKMTGRKYNTVIDACTFSIIEAGYCMSGDDHRHNITSLVVTAEDYEENGLTYLVR